LGVEVGAVVGVEGWVEVEVVAGVVGLVVG
jgi:hypothetical protein